MHLGPPHGMVLSRRCILRVAGAPQDAFMPDCAGWQREALCIGPRRLLHNGRPACHRVPHCCRHLPGLALTIPAACPYSYSFRYPPQVSAHRHSRTLQEQSEYHHSKSTQSTRPPKQPVSTMGRLFHASYSMPYHMQQSDVPLWYEVQQTTYGMRHAANGRNRPCRMRHATRAPRWECEGRAIRFVRASIQAPARAAGMASPALSRSHKQIRHIVT